MQTRDVAAELLESLPDPVIGCDAGGTIVFWSRAAEEAYGYPAAEALGRRAASLLHTRFPAPLLEISEELGDLGRWQGRLEHRCKDGRTVSVHSRWVARYDEEGSRVGSFAIERELAHEGAPPAPAPRQPQPVEGAGPPAGAVAHELTNALAIIINYTAFVTAELEASEQAPAQAARDTIRADLREVQAAAERALELTRRLQG